MVGSPGKIPREFICSLCQPRQGWNLCSECDCRFRFSSVRSDRGVDICGLLQPNLRRHPSPGTPIFSTSRNPSKDRKKFGPPFRVQLCTSRGATEESSPRREPWVKRTNESSPGRGERDLRSLVFCRPCRGLDGFGVQTHGFTVGYYLSRLRRFNCQCWLAEPKLKRRLVRKSFSCRAKARPKAAWYYRSYVEYQIAAS